MFTSKGRQKHQFKAGDFQRKYLDQGVFKEGELIRIGKIWFFNIVVDIPDVAEKTGESKIRF